MPLLMPDFSPQHDGPLMVADALSMLMDGSRKVVAMIGDSREITRRWKSPGAPTPVIRPIIAPASTPLILSIERLFDRTRPPVFDWLCAG
jgi:hypothetical protein